MTHAMVARGRRAKACKHWRWVPGMKIRFMDEEMRIADVSGQDVVIAWWDEHAGYENEGYLVQSLDERAIPDLSDPATLGCLLALVREAWDDASLAIERAYSDRDEPQWMIAGWSTSHHYQPRNGYPTEAEALVAALEAAP